jgi:serine/threonine protein kinase
VEIISALCDALTYLHGQGLIHRDIKPANIIFVNGRPKLADIGLVTEINESQHRASLVGTEGYLPPEGPGTTAGDLFALGKVLEEMLVRGTDSPHPPDESRARLGAVIKKACAENPAERFADAREMREAVMRANEV